MAPASFASQALAVSAVNTISRPRKYTLAGELMKSRGESNFHDPVQDYYPTALVRQLVNQGAIEKEFAKFDGALRALTSPEDEENRKFYGHFNGSDRETQMSLASWVASNAHKTFATAVVSGFGPLDLLAYMAEYKNQNFTDKELSSDAVQQMTSDFMEDPAKADIFCQQRWKFLAPVFSPAQYDHDLPSECIFPFKKDATVSKTGAFGSVSKVRVHPEHQQHLNMEYVAIKEIQVPKTKDTNATDSAWEAEARALRNINNLRNDNLTRCIAAIRRGDRRYFMFPWARGGSLQDYWETSEKRDPSASIIRDAIQQLRGLADGVDNLHNCKSGETDSNLLTVPNSSVNNTTDGDKNIRHGDLKPENILRFFDAHIPDAHVKTTLGTLKIADMGLAKQHVVATQHRTKNTSQRYGTVRYEAPEALTEIGGRSRLYDVWSLGCITLEFIIWILHGNTVLEKFHAQVGGDAKHACQYFEFPREGKPPEVHHVVSVWMSWLRRVDPECSQETAIKDLLDVVQNRLLVIALDPRSAVKASGRKDSMEPQVGIGNAAMGYRATADEFRHCLDHILKKANKLGSNYLYTGKSRNGIKIPATKALPQVIPAHASGSFTSQRGATHAYRYARTEYALPPVQLRYLLQFTKFEKLQEWKFPIDNAFAQQLESKIGPWTISAPQSQRARLCNQCSNRNFWVGGFTLDETLDSLRASSATCDFCSMLLDVHKRRAAADDGFIHLERESSNLKLAGAELPALSILRSSESITPMPIQLGFPVLSKPGSNVFFELIRLWLKDCDDMHADCRPRPSLPKTESQPDSPTRLIDICADNASKIRLIDTREEKVSSDRYIALSHPWGDTEKYPPFSTWRRDGTGLKRDIDSFKKAIPYDDLPATFKDAIICARALGIRYLWIDSICIIQGTDGDFNEEAKNMEQVFTGAYCVLAASRATNQHDGFLGLREQRRYITFQRANEAPFYVCDPIDDFSKDVIEGSLNQRGWVLQERALARRTIYFTSTQTYFECGNGVRCETLVSMHNRMADFLGDPRFPEKAMRSNSRALQIAYYQDLYKVYSRLQFSRCEDRPFAIAGLEKRLRQAFGTKGGFGIFDDGDKDDRGLFHRSLLWRHGDEEEFQNGLKPIDFSKRGIHVPSWSWMAYEGGIDYTTPEGGSADWELQEISEPWTQGFTSSTRSAPQDGIIAIPAIVRNFKVANRLPDEVKLFYDTGRTRGSDGERAQCVIVAKDKDGRAVSLKRHYVLLVASKQEDGGRGRKVYERIGAGFMLGKHIDLKQPGIEAEIH